MPRLAPTRPKKMRAGTADLPLAARRHPFVNEVEQGLRRCGVDLAAHDPVRIVIGVSGGADSVSLLLACLGISRRQSGAKLVPIAVHVHHHLRETADDDADWVTELCARCGIQLELQHVHPADVPGNVAANARRLRYEALARVAFEERADFIAVAHHGEDQLETMIAALCRGAGLDGLAGMPWARALNTRMRLIRPLLGLQRHDCEAFCRAAEIRWRDDPSNLDQTKARNRLRRDVLPVLDELWPDAAGRVAATAELVNAAKIVLDQLVQEKFGPPSKHEWDRRELQSLPRPIIAAGLRRAALHLMPGIGDDLGQRVLLDAAMAVASFDRHPHRFDWPGGLQAHVSSKTVALLSPRKGSGARS